MKQSYQDLFKDPTWIGSLSDYQRNFRNKEKVRNFLTFLSFCPKYIFTSEITTFVQCNNPFSELHLILNIFIFHSLDLFSLGMLKRG